MTSPLALQRKIKINSFFYKQMNLVQHSQNGLFLSIRWFLELTKIFTDLVS